MSFDVPGIKGNLRYMQTNSSDAVLHTRAAGTSPLHRPSVYAARNSQPPENIGKNTGSRRVSIPKSGNRVKWFSVLVGLGCLPGYMAGLLLTSGVFTWSGLLVATLVAIGLAFSAALLHGHSAKAFAVKAFAVASLCVAVEALVYMVFVDPGLWVVVIMAFFWVALSGVAISGQERRP